VAISQQPHQLKLCKVRASQAAGGGGGNVAVVGRQLRFDEFDDEVDSTVDRTHRVTANNIIIIIINRFV